MSFLKDVRIETARFTNVEHDTIEVLWEGEDGKLRPHYIPSNDLNNPDYLVIAEKGFDIEAITEITAIEQRAASVELRNMFKSLAADEVQRMKEQTEAELEKIRSSNNLSYKSDGATADSIIEILIENNTNEDALFRNKLALFEIPVIKDSTDKMLKTNIRKATSLMELIEIVKPII